MDIREQNPEADILEQQIPLDPLTPPDLTPASAAPQTTADANEADQLEQQTAVPGDDEDDYPHEALPARWS